MSDTTLDYHVVEPGLRVWDYDLREAIVGEIHHVAQDGTNWYNTTSLDGERRGLFDSKRMWFRHPSTGKTVPEPVTEEQQDWLDDAERFAGQGAFVTVTADNGEYTDFKMTPVQVDGVFKYLAGRKS